MSSRKTRAFASKGEGSAFLLIFFSSSASPCPSRPVVARARVRVSFFSLSILTSSLSFSTVSGDTSDASPSSGMERIPGLVLPPSIAEIAPDTTRGNPSFVESPGVSTGSSLRFPPPSIMEIVRDSIRGIAGLVSLDSEEEFLRSSSILSLSLMLSSSSCSPSATSSACARRHFLYFSLASLSRHFSPSISLAMASILARASACAAAAAAAAAAAVSGPAGVGCWW
mmetsp:Transcript_9883/g.19471  ORF Transcript_9883/g.19471 Transcript_9883/m.19471 type:complete len:226 (-) Transcript_9883:121-798(-)